MPRFNQENNRLVGKRPYSINRSTCGTTTSGAQYPIGQMCNDSYEDVYAMLVAKHRKLCQFRKLGFDSGLADMINATKNEIALVELLMETADKWLYDAAKKHSGRRGVYDAGRDD